MWGGVVLVWIFCYTKIALQNTKPMAVMTDHNSHPEGKTGQNVHLGGLNG